MVLSDGKSNIILYGSSGYFYISQLTICSYYNYDLGACNNPIKFSLGQRATITD